MIVVYFTIGVFFAGFISYSAVMEAYRNKKIEKNVKDLQQQAKTIQNENNALSKTIDYLGSQENIEKTAKEKLNMQKPDENVVVVKASLSNSQPEITQENSVEVVLPKVPNYKKWINFFFKYS